MTKINDVDIKRATGTILKELDISKIEEIPTATKSEIYEALQAAAMTVLEGWFPQETYGFTDEDGWTSPEYQKEYVTILRELEENFWTFLI